MRNLILVSAALLVGTGFTMAQQQPASIGDHRTGIDLRGAMGRRARCPDRAAGSDLARGNAPSSGTTGQAPGKETAPADPGSGKWDPPQVTAPTTQR